MSPKYLAVLILVGCSSSPASTRPDSRAIDSAIDAAEPDFSCHGAALPTSAPATLTVSGTTTTASNQALGGVMVSAYVRGNPTALATVTSDTEGAYSVTVASGGVPLDGYLQASVSGYGDAYLYGAMPVAKDLVDQAVPLAEPAEISTLASLASATQSLSNGVLLVRARDCGGTPLAGVTFETIPAGMIRYIAGTLPSATTAATDASGMAFVFDVAPGEVQLDATSGAIALRTTMIDAYPGGGTLAGIAP